MTTTTWRRRSDRLHAVSRLAQATIAFLVCASATYAGNLTFMQDTPMAAFTEEDHAMMLQNAEAVLSDAKTPVTRSWKNDKTGSSGSAQTLSAFTSPNGESCKRLRLINKTSKLNGKATYTLCNMADKGWQLVPNDYAPPPKQSSASASSK